MNKFLECFKNLNSDSIVYSVQRMDSLYYEAIIYRSINFVESYIENTDEDLLITVQNINKINHKYTHHDKEDIEDAVNIILDRLIKHNTRVSEYLDQVYIQLLSIFDYDAYYYNAKDNSIKSKGMCLYINDNEINHHCFNYYTIKNYNMHQYNKEDLIQSEDYPDFFEYVLDNGGNPFTTDKFTLYNETFMEYDTIMIPHRKRYFHNRIQDNHSYSLRAWDNITSIDKNKLSKKKKEYIAYIEKRLKEDYNTIEDLIEEMNKVFFKKKGE